MKTGEPVSRSLFWNLQCAAAAAGLILTIGAAPLLSQEGAAIAEGESVLRMLQASSKYLASQIPGYLFGMGADATLDYLNHKKSLDEVAKDLQGQLARDRQIGAADRRELQGELRAAQAQLGIFNQLQTRTLTQADLDRLKQENRDSQRDISALIDNQQGRIRDLEEEVRSLKAKFAAMEARSTPRPDAPQSAVASFDCNRASNASERLICDNSMLSEADGRLGRVYQSLYVNLASSVSRTQATMLMNSEVQWINWRNQQIWTACVFGGQVNMNCVMGLWESRITALQKDLNLFSTASIR
jgi:uncharacterized protein YecT (DUF1311 family)